MEIYRQWSQPGFAPWVTSAIDGLNREVLRNSDLVLHCDGHESDCYLNYDVQSSPHMLQSVVHHTTVTGYVIALTRE